MSDLVKPQILEMTNVELYVGTNRGKVVIDFHRSVSVMEIEPEHAEAFARLLMKHAQRARGSELFRPPIGG